MRYITGCLNLSQERDYPLLRQLARSGFATDSQLFEFMQLGRHERSRRSFRWRVQRLVEHNLVGRHTAAVLGAEYVYSLTEQGTQRVEAMGEGFAVSLPKGRRDSHAPNVLHSIDLNNIQLGVLRAGLLAEWVPEIAIHSANRLTPLAYAKDYDAIVRLRLDGRTSEFALEYERTAKSEADYIEIAGKIATERNLTRFLYLTANQHLLTFVSWHFRNVRSQVYFGRVDDWHEKLLDMAVFRWSSKCYEQVPLRVALSRDAY